MVVGGVHECGVHAWLGGVCMVAGGMCGFGGMCVVAGWHAWLQGGGGAAWLWGWEVVCVVAGGMRGWGDMHGCQEGGMVGGGGGMWGMHGCRGSMHGCRGACMIVGECAWLQGVCMVARGCIGYNEIWSMSRRYTSYWNAFLLQESIILINPYLKIQTVIIL